MKTCTKCGQPGEFSKRRRSKDGLKSWCKACDKAYNKAWREANPEKERERNKAWHGANREKAREQKKAWDKDNPEKRAEQKKAWKKANREKVRGYSRKRRARKANAPGFHTTEQWQARIDYYGGRCYFCGSNEDITQEHRIPLSRGGPDWPANLVPACGSCNYSKGNKTEFEYLTHLERHYEQEIGNDSSY